MGLPRTGAAFHPDDPREDQFASMSAGTTGFVIDLGKEFAHVQVINDGTDSIFVSGRGDTPTSSSSHPEVKPGEDIRFIKPQSPAVAGRRFIGVCANSGTQPFRVFAWQ